MVFINSLVTKQISQRWQRISSFIKVIAYYPLDTFREKKPDFPGAATALGIFLICFYLAIFAFYYKIGLGGYLMPWSGSVERIEYRSPAASNMPDVSLLHVLKDGAAKELVLYEVTAQKINSLKIEKGVKVRKPAFYTEVLFGDEGISFSYLVSDFMFFIFGVLLFIFAAVSGGSFITIIFASVFMMKSKYAKK